MKTWTTRKRIAPEMKTSPKQTHTPGPWKVDGDDIVSNKYWVACVGTDVNGVNQANARLIVTAVNSHAELLEACQNARNVLAGLVTGDLKEIKADSPALQMLRNAITRATGKGE